MTTFQIGKTYSTRSACDYDTIFAWTVTARTAKQVTLENSWGKTTKRGVYIWNGIEHCKPEGTYSMCPIISAERDAA
jgi:hypothetical protein